MERKDWTPGMVRFYDYLRWIAAELLGIVELNVRFPLDMNANACYGRTSATGGIIEFNVGALGLRWFDRIGVRQDELMIHEFGHHLADDHYSEEFHQACCKLGAKLKQLALEQPGKMSSFVKAEDK